MRKLIFVILLTILSLAAFAQPVERIKWARIEQLDSLQNIQPRPVFVYLYTTWCGYCQLFQKTTLRNPQVTKNLNAHFYAVSFDAESKGQVTIGGRAYRFQLTGIGTGMHSLAIELMRPYAQSGFPGLVFVSADLQPLTATFGMTTARDFLGLQDRLLLQLSNIPTLPNDH